MYTKTKVLISPFHMCISLQQQQALNPERKAEDIFRNFYLVISRAKRAFLYPLPKFKIKNIRHLTKDQDSDRI